MAEEKIKWTDEQEEAIQAIDNNALVSASAGSGIKMISPLNQCLPKTMKCW